MGLKIPGFLVNHKKSQKFPNQELFYSGFFGKKSQNPRIWGTRFMTQKNPIHLPLE